MTLLTPAEFVKEYTAIGVKKTEMRTLKMLILSVFAGIFIALASVAVSTAVFSIENAGVARLIAALIFPVGLIMLITTGSELFTGNCLLTIPLLSKKIKLTAMLRVLLLSFIGNFLGAILIAVACDFFGQFDVGNGALAVYTMKVAAAKSALPFENSFVLAILTNILVCVAVMGAVSAKDGAGRAIGAYIPIFVFILCGFEHSIANIYFIPAGIFAARIPEYATLATNAGIDISTINWSGFLNNMLPVTLGNVLGGVGFAALLRYCHGKKK